MDDETDDGTDGWMGKDSRRPLISKILERRGFGEGIVAGGR